jgi:CRISPR-associated endonuclease/helicase Cas3
MPWDPGARWQTLQDHLMSVADVSRQLALEARPGDQAFADSAYAAGLLHDLGKYRAEFQNMLLDAVAGKPKRKVPHSIYGAAMAHSAGAYDVGLAILGHHAGLRSAAEIKQIITPKEIDDVDQILQGQACVDDEIRKKLNGRLLKTANLSKDVVSFELRERMLFSCLIDADRLDCVKHETGKLPESKPLDAANGIESLLDYIKSRADRLPEGKVKRTRAEIMRSCLDAAKSRSRLFSLTVPTGGGKTLASMAFALERARLTPDEIRRIIVVIPFLSIIEQNASVYREALGEGTVFEHHSGDLGRLEVRAKLFRAPTELESEAPDSNERCFRLVAENWGAPIIVTTSVRFFESLYSNHPSDLRRIHNIARSVVILDEVQTLPKEFLRRSCR